MSVNVNAKDAVKIAVKYYSDVVGTNAQISVEEIYLDEANKQWNITLGIFTSPYGLVMAGKDPKDYKIFIVDAMSGDVLSMKIRKT